MDVPFWVVAAALLLACGIASYAQSAFDTLRRQLASAGLATAHRVDRLDERAEQLHEQLQVLARGCPACGSARFGRFCAQCGTSREKGL